MKTFFLQVSQNFPPFTVLSLRFNLEFGGDDFSVQVVEECRMRDFMYCFEVWSRDFTNY